MHPTEHRKDRRAGAAVSILKEPQSELLYRVWDKHGIDSLA